jgi:spore germination cell wall hydrolase CwlJ-like protein
VAIAQLAAANVVPSVSTDVLWYHATYVAPSWGRRLNMAEKIGAHIFYRA